MGKRDTISLDLRKRILATYDEEGGTREAVAKRFRVSLGMIKKLLSQRRHAGDIGPRHHLAGRKPQIVAVHEREMRLLLSQKPDLTLKELRKAVALDCSLQAIHVVLAKMGLTYKKRHSALPNRTGPTSLVRAKSGAADRAASTRHG